MLIEQAKRVFKIESDAILALIERLDDKFIKAIDILDSCQGRVVVTGMGKSGLIGKKIASTFASIGVPAFFLHPADGVHGDLGMLTRGDVIVGISNSGQTSEILDILPVVKRFGLKLIALTGNMSSSLAKMSDVALDVSVKEEACPLDMVPTASTTVTLAMGDALSVVLMDRKGVRREDFAVFHPGGSLGKSLLLKVEDVMVNDELIPIVQQSTPLKEVVREITAKKKGVAIIVDNNRALIGIITDGDLRRALESGENLFDATALDIMSPDPKTIDRGSLGALGVKIMEEFSITSLVIVDSEKCPVGLVHLHDLLKAGII